MLHGDGGGADNDDGDGDGGGEPVILFLIGSGYGFTWNLPFLDGRSTGDALLNIAVFTDFDNVEFSTRYSGISVINTPRVLCGSHTISDVIHSCHVLLVLVVSVSLLSLVSSFSSLVSSFFALSILVFVLLLFDVDVVDPIINVFH